MTKRLNGMAKWIGIILVILTIVFNAGMTYNHLSHLSKDIEEIKVNCKTLNEKFDKLILQLALNP